MKMRVAMLGSVMMLAAMAGCQTSGRQSRMDLSTPGKVFEAWALAVENYDETGAGDLFSARSARAAALKEDLLEAVFSARHFRRVMRAWFPENTEMLVDDPGDAQHVKAMRDFAASVTITIDGDRATVSGGAAQTGMGFLVRRGGQWRFDLDRSPGVEEYPAGTSSGMLHLAARMGPELREVAREIERGRLTSVAEVKRALDERMKGIPEGVERELRGGK